MAYANASLNRRGFGQTMRPEAWWVQPALTFLGLSAFIAYATWAAFQGADYRWGPYLSPFYSPELFGDPTRSWFGVKPGWWPGWLPFSPALLILWAPGGFRLTCYYYRGAYYKSFWADPPSCTVSEPRKSYRGENSFPLILQNIHRYFLYLGLIFILFLAHDLWQALWFPAPFAAISGNSKQFGVGVGTLVLGLNLTLLGGYTFGCHSLRHLVGGGLDQLSRSPLCQKTYRCVSCFNRQHLLWAWTSLFWVGFSDFYVRMCARGVWHDLRLL